MEKLPKALYAGLVRAAHDCSEGGLGVALAEMAFAGHLGANVFLNDVIYKGKQKKDDVILFSESNTRFVVEVEREHQKAFEKALASCPLSLIGCVTDSRELKIYGLSGKICLEAKCDQLKEAWSAPLKSV